MDKIVAEDESEEAEYAALMTAADASAELLLDGAPGRRVVLAADVVELAGAVPKKLWAAVHVDTEDDADPDDDLAWYATQEISECSRVAKVGPWTRSPPPRLPSTSPT